MTPLEQDLINALHQKKLPQFCLDLLKSNEKLDSESDRELVERVLETCQKIGAYCTGQKDKILQKLADAGANVSVGENDHSISYRLFHTFTIDLNREDLDLLIPILKEENYLFWYPVEGGGWEAYKRMYDAMEVIKTDAFTTRLIIRWNEDRERGRLSKLLLPGVLDFQWVQLPKPLWPLYYVTRPMRLILDRFGAKKPPILGPYLGTPVSLIKPILDLVGATEQDKLVDIGCGDGRIVIEAADQIGCEAVGVEINDQLISIAHDEVKRRGLADKVKIVHSNASDLLMADASIVFIFLPVGTLRTLIPQLRKQLKKGAKIITHEQAKPDFGEGNQPDASKLIVADGAITVAYIWQV